MKHPRRPYLRPYEPPKAFADLAKRYQSRYQPADPEIEALVNTLIYTAWRIQRYRLDEAAIERHGDIPGQSYALESVRMLLASVEQIYCSTLSALECWPMIHALDASEVIESKARNHNLGSFRQIAPNTPTGFLLTPPPPKTKPN